MNKENRMVLRDFVLSGFMKEDSRMVNGMDMADSYIVIHTILATTKMAKGMGKERSLN